MTINELVDKSHANAREKGFWGDPPTPLESMALVTSEISEAVEELRKVDPAWSWIPKPGKPEGVDIELADAVIRIADFCGFHGIDLEFAIQAKMAYNREREFMHGKAK